MLDVLKQLKLVKQFRKFQYEWNLRSPKQKWQVVFNFGAKISEILGIRVYTDAKNDWYSYFGSVMAIAYAILVSYTIWFHSTRGDFLKGIECTYTAGIVTTVCIFRLAPR